METRQLPALAIEHVEDSFPAAFRLVRVSDGKSLTPVTVPAPNKFPVKGHPNSNLMRELRWYLEQFLDYPFPPETDHADQVLDSLRAWGAEAFNALFNHRDAGSWLTDSGILQVRCDDPHILAWPWEALYDPQAGAYLAHQRGLERRLNRLPDPQPASDLPNERVNVLLVVCRPYQRDVRYRSIARPVIELIQRQNLPAHVDVLRPPTFGQLREHLRQHAGYYHVLHFDGHGGYGDGGSASPHQFKASQGCLVFEDEKSEPDPKSARDLSALLREYAVPAVVLNACQSAQLDEQAEDAFATVATALLQSGMRSVVAMAYSLYVSGAQVFLPAFYKRLFESGSVAESVRAGRQQMLADKKRLSARGPYPLEDWLLPVLYQQDPLDLSFATQAKLEDRESRLPQDVREYRDPYGFIGRDSAILEMERALQRNAPCILVQGLGGVGKTTLARGFLRWLDDTGGLEGALWFDFRDIRTAEYVINRTGEAFCSENFGAEKNKIDLLARKLRERRVLMVWDNFESVAQNLPTEDREELGRLLDAIRGTKGKVIMTSRLQEEWLRPAWRVKVPRDGLGGLDGEERWEYCEVILRELNVKVNRDDPELKKLMDQLAGHPLAMRMVLPTLEKMLPAKVSEALRTNLAELGLDEKEEQGRLFATLRFVEQGLPEHLRPMMDLVALHESYLDADYLEAMAAQVDSEWTRQRVGELVTALSNAGLARDICQNTYEIHPLLTSYLRSKGAAPEACRSAFVDVMARVADNLAQREYNEQRAPFSLHGANFQVARRLAQGFQALGALTQSLASYADNSRNFVEASRLFSNLAEKGAAKAHWKVEASAYHALGRIARQQRDFATAWDWYSKALKIWEQHGDQNGAANTYHQLGILAEEQRDFATARGWYLRSVEIEEKQGNLDGAAVSYHQLGVIAQQQRDFAAASKWYGKALEIEKEQDNLYGVAKTYHQLGNLACLQRDFATAQKWYLESLDIEKQHGNLDGLAISYHQLGVIARQQRDFAAAREWYLKALDISEKRADWSDARLTYGELGRVARDQEDFATARGWFLKSLEVDHQLGDLHGAANACSQLGILAAMQGNFEESGKWLSRCIASFQRTNDRYAAEGNVRNFLICYGKAPPAEKEKLKTIWSEEGLGPFPEERATSDDQPTSAAPDLEFTAISRPPAPVTSAQPDVPAAPGAATAASPPPDAPAPVAGAPPEKFQPPRALAADNVHFTLTGQSVLAPGCAYELLFWVHVEQQKATVLEQASIALDLPISEVSVRSEGPYPLQRGSRLSVRLKIDGLKCVDNHKWITWTGEIGSTAFVVNIPVGTAEGSYAGSASIRLNGGEIARMSFLVRVGEPKHEVSEIPSQTTAHRSAFASYASQDRAEVLSRVQGMEAAYRGLDVFVDVISLRSGQKWEQELKKRIARADVFYLFWCRHAKSSAWVEKEWHWALRAKGEDFINPIPLETPDQAPPPQELAASHFNDPLLAFIAAAGGGHPQEGAS